jgi:hypothetical protein
MFLHVFRALQRRAVNELRAVLGSLSAKLGANKSLYSRGMAPRAEREGAADTI